MSDIADDWPVLIDDDGSGRYGTPATNAKVFDPIKAAINAQVLSVANPTLTPADIIDEVVTARGNKADLNERIESVIDADGNLISSGQDVVSISQGQSLVHQNVIPNGDFLLWPNGDSGEPSYWTVTPTNDTTFDRVSPPASSFAAGNYYIHVGAGATVTQFEQELLSVAEMAAHSKNFQGTNFAFGAHVKAADDATIALEVYDGIGTTRLTATGGADVWLAGIHTINSAATKLTIRVLVLQAPAGDNYIGAIMGSFSDVAPKTFMPCPMQLGTVHFSAVAAIGSNIISFVPGAPGRVEMVTIYATVITDRVLQVDVTTWNKTGAAQQSVFAAGGPSITATAAPLASKAPDGTYYRRCLQPPAAGVRLNGSVLALDIVTDGNSGGGTVPLAAEIRIKQYIRPLEAYKAIAV